MAKVRTGMLTLGAKLGPKLISIGAKFAIIIMISLLFHEYGHIFGNG